MAHERTAVLLEAARALRHGVGAFNVITLEHAEAVILGAERAGCPVILQISENAIAFHGGNLLPIAAACSELVRTASIPAAIHLDHVTKRQFFDGLEHASVSSVMFDASESPYEDNLAATAEVVRWAHDVGIHVEAELGEVGGKDGAHAPGVRTDPDEAAQFVARTGVDSLAVAVGSSHAMTDRTAELDLALISRLRDAVHVPLVLHGSSGVNDDSLQAAVAAGIVKVNIGTALNIAYTDSVRAGLEDSALVDPRKFLREARQSMASRVEHMLKLLTNA
ncbi:MAG: fructose-bisphosphate aldolase [Aeromicrobium sp.]|jgi:fructose-bisphosphate aldolase class II|nr:fructose-bisphosphate aldolase [Aeromicrobium sp.]